MGKRKPIDGQCRICGLFKPLTYEHVPPKVTFNKTTKYISVSIMDLAKIDNPFKNPPKGKIEQGGMGFHSLCADCNNFLGNTYVKSYEKWVQVGIEILAEQDTDYVQYRVREQNPIKIIKHIISMFLALNGEWYLDEYPELAEFVKNPDSTNLPDRYRVFTYLNNEGKIRYSSHKTVFKPEVGVINCTEITFPPFGFVLTIDFDQSIKGLTDITSFKNQVQSPQEMVLSFCRLPTYLPMPLDYRTKQTIEADIEKGLAAKKRIQDKYNL